MMIRAHFEDGSPAPAYAIILKFEKEDPQSDPAGDHVQGHHPHPPISSTMSMVTNSAGMAACDTHGRQLKGVFRVTKASAGSYGFQSLVRGNTLDVTINDWPTPIAELREALQGSAGSAVRQMADTVLLDSRDLMSKFFDPSKVDAWTADDGDNPHIRGGALLVALSISCLLARTDAERTASLKGIGGILNWLEHRRHPNEPGYLLRWKQSELDSRVRDNWKAEPSLDEYSGLLLGLSWLRNIGKHIKDFPADFMSRANSLWSDIGNYLKGTEGWLVRPGARDLTTRGPDLAASAWILSQLFEGFKNEHPLHLSDNVRNIIRRSKDYFKSCNLSENGFKHAYASTIALVDPILKAQDAEKALSIGELVLDFLAFASVVVTPAASSLFFMLAGATNAISDFYQDKVLNVDAFRLWTLFGTALGHPYGVDGGGFNAQIFDRNNLAAFPAGNVGMGYVTERRYTRRLAADRDGWRILTLAGRFCHSKAGVMTDLPDILNAEVGHFRAMSEVPVGLETVEGFVLGWSILCLIADVDPGIDWSKYV